jgi:hypothetical protein
MRKKSRDTCKTPHDGERPGMRGKKRADRKAWVSSRGEERELFQVLCDANFYFLIPQFLLQNLTLSYYESSNVYGNQ